MTPTTTDHAHRQRVALVTGGSRGIGSAIAKRLAMDGVAVAINYTKSVDAAQRVVDEITSAGGKAVAIQADLADPVQITRLFNDVDKVFGGGIDILINNAGVFDLIPTEQITLADYNRLMNVNVRAVVLATTEAAKRMREAGRIVSIGSGAADRAIGEGGALYGMTKSALQAFTRGVARELGVKNITVNLVQPGPIDTDMNPADSEFAVKLSAMTSIGRYGRAEEISDLVGFIASPAASYITGATITADGGLNA